jgi:hypothetical protein
MVPSQLTRRHITVMTSLSLIAATVTGCATTPPKVYDEFCALTKNRLPILLSRKDSLPTQREVAKLNAINKQRCEANQMKEPTQ